MELTIEKLVYGGDGLARMPPDEHGRGKAVFVPFVLEGEKIDAVVLQEKPGFARSRVNKILEPSAHRTDPCCPYFTRCGGCHYQHSSYQHQLEIKASILKETLRRIAKLELQSELNICPSPPWNYRNRTRLRVQITPKFALGYFRFNSHALQPIEECPISSPLINRAIGALWEFGRAGRTDASIREIQFFASANDSQLLLEAYAARTEKQLLRSAQDDKKRISDKKQNVSFGLAQGHADKQGGNDDLARGWAETLRQAVPGVVGVTVFPESNPTIPSQGEPEPLAVVGSSALNHQTLQAAYRVSAGSFFQTNRHLTDELVSIVTAGRSGHTALDLYAGVGLFSVVLSQDFACVIAVESSRRAFADLEYNCPANVKAVHAAVEQYLKNIAGKLRPDLVVVDPPRNGLGESVARSLAALEAPAVTYVSCDPATLARDLVPLLAAGYRVEQAHLVDLFPQTFHLESVVQLAR